MITRGRVIVMLCAAGTLEVGAGQGKPAPGQDRGGTGSAGQTGATVSVQSMPPVVIRTEPAAGDTQVDAAKVPEIRATFSKDMADKSWSWAQLAEDTFPKVTGEIRYEKDRRTCVLPVKLEPGKTYVLWLNTARFQNFKDGAGQPAVPYLLVFETKK
jgi:RNA polymerase sigma-70 factor (ECF subfamily)